MYAQKQNNLYINLFATSSTKVMVNGKNQVEISQQTQYPWEGAIKINISPVKKESFSVYLRIPGWVKNQPVPSDLYSYKSPVTESVSIKVNGKTFTYQTENGYAVLAREWKKGDVVEYDIPMNVHRVVANSNVEADRGKIAIERGPVVYCLEGVDNDNKLSNLIIPDNAELTASFASDKLKGIEVITGEGIKFTPSEDGLSISSAKQKFTAIPYYIWNNRGINVMKVWIPNKIGDLLLAKE
jgi:DUF1680 family protein